MDGNRLLVGGSEDTASLTGGIMRNNFMGTIEKVRMWSAVLRRLITIKVAINSEGESRTHGHREEKQVLGGATRLQANDA